MRSGRETAAVAATLVADRGVAPVVAARRPLFERLLLVFGRFGNPLDWTDIDRAILIIVLSMLSSGITWIQLHLFAPHGNSLPNWSPWVEHGFEFAQGLVFLCWTPFLPLALHLRKRGINSRAFLYLVAAMFATALVPAAYFSGPFTSPIWMLIGGTAIVGLLMFPMRVAFLALGILVPGTLGAAFATWLGWLPHASLLESPPMPYARNGTALLWTWVQFSNSILFMGISYITFTYTVKRWRQRERELAQAHAALARSQEELARATDLIRRYVATQVAEELIKGDQDTLGLHERRKLTIFFSDIKGFSAASDRMSPDELSRVLNEYLTEMAKIADAHGATLDKFVGDVIMIFFGAPRHMDPKQQSLAAVRMAIDMGRRMEELRRKWQAEGIPFPFEKRIGINTGIVSVGNFGSRERLDYTVIGKEVNVAARLEANCEPGKILLSHATWALVRDAIPCVPRGELTVKGIHHPIKVYEVATG